MSDVQLRAAVRADLEALVEIEQHAFASPWSRQSLSEEFDHAHSNRTVAVDTEGAVVGFVIY